MFMDLHSGVAQAGSGVTVDAEGFVSVPNAPDLLPFQFVYEEHDTFYRFFHLLKHPVLGEVQFNVRDILKP